MNGATPTAGNARAPAGETLPGVVVRNAVTRRWLRFSTPVEILTTRRLAEVIPLLQRVEQAVEEQRLYAAGFIAYEAAPAFDPALTVRRDGRFPLLWFGLFRSRVPWRPPPAAMFAPDRPLNWRPNLTRVDYGRAIRRIKAYIKNGHTYQVNFTFRLRAAFGRGAWPLFTALADAQDAPYGAFIDTGTWAICSASPELFFARRGRAIWSRPMKGTAARGLTPADDQAQAAQLRRSAKEQAENVMIVDMVRNDLGRIAPAGSVRVSELFRVEKYPTVWQLTSTVRARTEASFVDGLRATFPPASITGAPKRRTMEIIAETESAPRRIYTGCIGFLAPGRRAQFNVAIRTVLIDKARKVAEYGVGGGIVWDSRPASEYAECRTKARLLTARHPPFMLLETMLWERGRGFFLLDLHLQRLLASADYFAFPLKAGSVRTALRAVERGFRTRAQKVRLRVARDGRIVCETSVWQGRPGGSVPRVGLARAPVNSADVFLYHKTTNRTVYDRALRDGPGYDDVILWNERLELTETTIANLVVELDGARFTPPVRCGLLPGTCRAWLLQRGRVQERVLTRDDLRRSRRIFLVNALRKCREVTVDITP